MAGFYPVCPGTPEYILGSPVFDYIKINLPGGNEFVVKAKNNSDENRYIQKAKLNGKKLERAYLTHDEIINGGTLFLEMGNEPNKEWASQEFPSSITTINSKE